MKIIASKQSAKSTLPGKQYSYAELVEYLDGAWSAHLKDNTLACIQKLDKAFGSISKKLRTIFISGTNGKSLTAYFTALLLKEEGLNAGVYSAPHILTYNERIHCNDEQISNKQFTDLGNEVLTMAESLGLKPHAQDILTMMALIYFDQNKVDVALLEVSDLTNTNPVFVCSPDITAITRITEFEPTERGNALLEKTIKNMLSSLKPGQHVVSGDQNKFSLQVMEDATKSQGGVWAMPIRKLAPLSYPYEQLHGRCAALAERIGSILVNECIQNESPTQPSLLLKLKGQRGRPTLEAKKQSELNPKRTLEQLWKETSTKLPGRFQVLDKEKPTILLDTASNLDAFENLLLGVRLLHYHRPLKGLVLILGCNNAHISFNELLKLLRYFFKKTSGQVIICPAIPHPGDLADESWDAEKVTNDIKSMKIKARSAHTFKEAFEFAEKSVDERNGLVVISGSSALISEYWHYKDIKKLQ